MVDLELAKEKISKKMYAEALQLLTELHKNFPDNEDIIFHLGKCYFYIDQYKNAEKFFRKILDCSEFSKDIKEYSKYYLAMVYNQEKKYIDALDMLIIADNEPDIYNNDNLINAAGMKCLELNKSCLYFKINEFKKKYQDNIDANKLIDFFNQQIQCETGDGSYDSTVDIIDGYWSVDCRWIMRGLCDFIIKNYVINAMQLYNYNGEYNNSIRLYERYQHRFADDVFLLNKLLNEYELASHKIILESKPRIIMAILTNMCDLNCIMCYQWKNSIQNINKKLVYIILDNLQYLEKIIWQGGEVLILPYFREILLKTIEFPRIHQIITTNFQNVGEEIIELMTKNNIHLIVSVDGAVKETYEKIRIGASFDNLEKNLKKINNYIIKYKSRMSLQINFLIMKNNYKEIPDILDFAHKYKFSIVVFLRCVTDNENLKITEEYEKEINSYIKQADIKAKEYNIKIIDVFSEFNDSVCDGKEKEKSLKDKKTAADKELFCHLPWYEMTVQEDNSVKPHCTCGYTRLTNTDKYNNIYDIWNNEVMQEYRKQILKSDNGKCIDICRQMSSDYRKNFNK